MDESLGEFLRREREYRGVSLEQLSQKTKISTRFLKCMETDQWDDLPKGAFVRGFLKSYALSIGVPVEEVLSRHEAHRPRESASENPFNRFRGIEVRNKFFVFLLLSIVIIIIAAYLSTR